MDIIPLIVACAAVIIIVPPVFFGLIFAIQYNDPIFPFRKEICLIDKNGAKYYTRKMGDLAYLDLDRIYWRTYRLLPDGTAVVHDRVGEYPTLKWEYIERNDR